MIGRPSNGNREAIGRSSGGDQEISRGQREVLGRHREVIGSSSGGNRDIIASSSGGYRETTRKSSERHREVLGSSPWRSSGGQEIIGGDRKSVGR